MSLLRLESDTRPAGALKQAPRFFDGPSRISLAPKPGAFERTESAELGPLTVARVTSTGHDIALEERACHTLLTPVRGLLTSEAFGRTLRARPADALLMSRGARRTRVEAPARAPYLAAVVRIPPDALEAAAERLEGDLAGGLRGGDVTLEMAADRGGTRSLTAFVAAMIEDLARPGTLLTHPRPRAAAGAMITELLVERLSEAGLPVEGRPAIDAATLRRVRRAEEHMRAHFGEIVTLAEVARAAGVGLRSLQLAFRAARGDSPREALAAIRLEAAHRRLSAPEAPTTVTAVAHDCGFTHLGRFATAYRARFGETPSETLLKGAAGRA